MYRSSKSRNFWVWLFYLVTWDDLDMYYGYKAQEIIRTNVSDTIHADSLALFALNIEILFADVTKPEKSTFWVWPDLWPHQWPLGQISYHVWKVHVQAGLSNGVWNLEISAVVWEIAAVISRTTARGGGAIRPPNRICDWPEPNGALVKMVPSVHKYTILHAESTPFHLNSAHRNWFRRPHISLETGGLFRQEWQSLESLEWHNAPQFDLGHIIDNGHLTLTMLKTLPKLNALCRLYDPSQTVVRFVKQVCTSS